MAHATTNTFEVTSSETPGIFTRFFNFLVKIAESNTRVAQVDYLKSLSDAELAEKGIRREDIARHVYRDVLYL